MKFNITITEALAEIKTIRQRIETKQAQLQSFLFRDSRLRDPMEKDGGSAKYIEQERQSIKDLQKRTIDLRLAIQEANINTKLDLNGTSMSVYEWLIWRREVAPTAQLHLRQMWDALQSGRRSALSQGVNVVAAAAAVQSNDTVREMIVNINEMELAKTREEVEKNLGELDGRLSLINATTTI